MNANGQMNSLTLNWRQIVNLPASLLAAISLLKFAPRALKPANPVLPRDASEALQSDNTKDKRFERSLQETGRMESEFVTNMSRELCTSLHSIVGFCELLVDEQPGKLNAKQREYLNYVLSSSHSLLQLSNNALDLSKAKAGQVEVSPEVFSINKAIAEVWSIIKPMAREKHITVQCGVDPRVDTVTLDRRKFKQVLLNLVTNAVKFNKEGGTVDIIAVPFGPERLRLEVEDTGIGIRVEDIDKLFVEFQQIDSGTDQSYGGTGLGLALTKRIVELQEGHISVQSNVGKGSRFIVVLPHLFGKQNA